jgi:hypothetical protein
MRKWFSLNAALIIAVEQNWFDIRKFSDAIFLSKLPPDIFLRTLTVSGIYFTIQSTLLIFQISSTYIDSMNARTAFIFGKRVSETENQLRALKEEHRKSGSNNAIVEREIDRLHEYLKFTIDKKGRTKTIISLTESILDIFRVAPLYIVLLYAVIGHGYLW